MSERVKHLDNKAKPHALEMRPWYTLAVLMACLCGAHVDFAYGFIVGRVISSGAASPKDVMRSRGGIFGPTGQCFVDPTSTGIPEFRTGRPLFAPNTEKRGMRTCLKDIFDEVEVSLYRIL